MTIQELKSLISPTVDMKKQYLRQQLAHSQKNVRPILLALCVFNLVLLIPDMVLISPGGGKLLISLLRVAFSLALLVEYHVFPRLRTFRQLSTAVTVTELLAVLVYLYVLNQYQPPDFMIQSIGVMILILAFFLVPNLWLSKLVVSIASVAVFFSFFTLMTRDIVPLYYCAAAVYLSLTIVLSGISSWMTDKYLFREYLAKQELIRISLLDPLTKTGNRYKLEREAVQCIDLCRSSRLPLSLVLIDIDDFKAINDQRGHLFGDATLVGLSEIIGRQADAAELLYRWGGDEFILLLPGYSLDQAVTFCQSARVSVEALSPDDSFKVTSSFGVVEMKEDSSFESLIQEADELLYSGKNYGKNTVQWNMEKC